MTYPYDTYGASPAGGYGPAFGYPSGIDFAPDTPGSGSSPSGGWGPAFGYPSVPSSSPNPKSTRGLKLAMGTQGWDLNVTSFSSPMYGTLSSAQTKKMAMYFPIRATQPDIKFEVVFRNEATFEDFQRFVRAHQQRSLSNPNVNNLVWLNWPERNIDNWTGVIQQFRAGGERGNFAPRASFVVALVDSMVSARTDIASIGAGWQSIFGKGMGPDAVLAPPTVAENQQMLDITGEGLISPNQGWNSNPNRGSSPLPGTPGWFAPGGGIVAGSGS